MCLGLRIWPADPTFLEGVGFFVSATIHIFRRLIYTENLTGTIWPLNMPSIGNPGNFSSQKTARCIAVLAHISNMTYNDRHVNQPIYFS